MKPSDNSAAVIVIGDEILSGRVQDQNTPFLIKELSERGVKVNYCFIIPDNKEIIGKIVFEYSKLATWTFTAGGIGPTPDDITMESIASAFGAPLRRNPALVKLIKKMYGERFIPEYLKMARTPKGTLILPTAKPNIPIVQFRNIFIFPGVPEFMRACFSLIKHRFKGIVNPVREMSLVIDEGKITPDMEETMKLFPEIKLGSYPCFIKENCRVKIVLEHEDESYLEEVYAYLKSKVGKYEASFSNKEGEQS